MDPRPTTYNACKKGREKGFKEACIPTCTSILGEDGGAVELKSKPESNPKPNSFTACDGSKNKKRRPNNPFARCRRAYEVAFEETQKGIAERAKAALAAALDKVNTDDEVETVVEAEEVEDKDDATKESPITEDVELRQLEEPEEERPTPYQVPPTDIVVEEAIQPEPKDRSAKDDEDAAVIESTTNIAEAVEAPIKLEAAAIVDESNDSGPIGSEAFLDQLDARANGPTGPAASDELPKEDIATDDDTIGPAGAENIHHDSPGSSPGRMNGPKETISASLSSDKNDNDDAIDAYIDAATPPNHVSVDLETSPIADL